MRQLAALFLAICVAFTTAGGAYANSVLGVEVAKATLPQRVNFTYDVPAGCPSISDFLKLLASYMDNSSHAPLDATISVRQQGREYSLEVRNDTNVLRGTSKYEPSHSCELLIAKAVAAVASARVDVPPIASQDVEENEDESQTASTAVTTTSVEVASGSEVTRSPSSDLLEDSGFVGSSHRRSVSLGLVAQTGGAAVPGQNQAGGIGFQYRVSDAWLLRAQVLQWFGNDSELSLNGRIPRQATFNQVTVSAGGCGSPRWPRKNLYFEVCAAVELNHLELQLHDLDDRDSVQVGSLIGSGGLTWEGEALVARLQFGGRFIPNIPFVEVDQQAVNSTNWQPNSLQPTAEISVAWRLGSN